MIQYGCEQCDKTLEKPMWTGKVYTRSYRCKKHLSEWIIK